MRLLAFERRWLMTVVDAILPSGASERLPMGAGDVGLERFFDDLFPRAPGRVVLGLRACLWLMYLGPLFFVGRLRTFGGLSAEERVAMLHRMRRSDVYLVREMPILFKTFACLGYCGLPEVQRRIGIDQADATPPAWARTGEVER